MSQRTRPRWKRMQTEESQKVVEKLRKEFPNTDAYRYNSASIRVRIIDPRFKGMSNEQRDLVVEPYLESLDERIRGDIMNLLTLYPNEPSESLQAMLLNAEFEEPSPSRL